MRGCDRWVYFPQHGQSFKLNRLDSVQAAVFVVESFKIAFFFYLEVFGDILL